MLGSRWELGVVWLAVFFLGLGRRSLGQSDHVDCQTMNKEATGVARGCSHLLRRSMDSGYLDCYKELEPNIPKDRKLTFTERLAINICIEECNFISSGYVEVDPPYKLDFEHIRDNAKKFVPEPKEESLQLLLEALETCERFYHQHPMRLDIKFPELDFIEQDCSPFATQIMVCATIYAMQESPNDLVADTPSCGRARAFFGQCVANVKTQTAGEPTTLTENV